MLSMIKYGYIQEQNKEEEETKQVCTSKLGYWQQVSRNSNAMSLCFNQDNSCFACGTNGGFRIFNCEPFKELFRGDFKNTGVGIVEMQFRCNYIAIVGEGSDSEFPPNKVRIWDSHQSATVGEIVCVSDIRGVRLQSDSIVTVLKHNIYIYSLTTLQKCYQLETVANVRGLCATSGTLNGMVLACPGLLTGQVRVEHFLGDLSSRSRVLISAHTSSLACIALSSNGRALATASSKGTVVRIFNTVNGTQQQEFRRGASKADICSMAFSPGAQWLAVSSIKGTVHVFRLETTHGFVKNVLPQYSFAQFRLPVGTPRSVVAFGALKNSVLIASVDGSFFRCTFDPFSGGEMVQRAFERM